MKQSRKSKKLSKSEESYNVYYQAQRNDVGKRHHLRRSTPRTIEDLQTMNEGFERERQKMTALINRLSQNCGQKTIYNHGILQPLPVLN
jgi:hypothetical protein